MSMTENYLKCLLDKCMYPEPTDNVQMIQTHASWLFITDNHVYKFKKPINLGFLDFSTLDRRRFYCNEEIRLNRRLCPDIYLELTELRETSKGVTLSPNDGIIIDYAVKMKRLPADGMLDILLNNNTITTDIINKIIRTIAKFHMSIKPLQSIPWNDCDNLIKFNWKENFKQAAIIDRSIISKSDINTIKSWIISFMDENTEIIQQRFNQGFFKECHGDIHLENICLMNNKIYIFDCIEFNERFRFCDTASDLAFLLMDLDFHNRHDLSERVFKSYKKITNDFIDDNLIIFYKIYRAFVRGKVESLKSSNYNISESDRNLAHKKSVDYFRLARGYIEQLKCQKKLIITCGLMGSGKSFIADKLAFELGIKKISSDVLRKHLFCNDKKTNVFVSYKNHIYSAINNAIVYSKLKKIAHNELSKGNSIIIDACFPDKKTREKFRKLSLNHNYTLAIIWVTCPEQINRQRLSKRHISGHSISDGRLDLFDLQKKDFQKPDFSEGTIISAPSNKPISKICNDIYYKLFDTEYTKHKI